MYGKLFKNSANTSLVRTLAFNERDVIGLIKKRDMCKNISLFLKKYIDWRKLFNLYERRYNITFLKDCQKNFQDFLKKFKNCLTKRKYSGNIGV